jgi:uncharacterized protein (DUF1800 family)
MVGSRSVTALLVGAALLAACNGGADTATAWPQEAEPSASSGQVAAAKSYKVSYYAAARFAEQTTFGPTPALIEELRTKGFAQWIDEQLALPAKVIDVAPVNITDRNLTPEENAYYRVTFGNLALTAPDQLRLRTVWSLSQFIVVGRKSSGAALASVSWTQMLLDNALGNYGELLRKVSIHPTMGNFLDNAQNRPKSAECPHCAPNENYARELMQLFSIGVMKLNPDGTPKRDAQGRIQETYTQRDVEELARALTGWQYDPDPPNRGTNFGNWLKPMVPSTWPPERDSGQKVVMGRVFPAGQPAPKDLDDTIDLLMKHENIGPFVALRLIQQFVASDPSPAYVKRVADTFRNNGAGVAGDMKAVIKAVLLDTEARLGDDPAKLQAGFGKYREPYLWEWAAYRALGCQRVFITNSYIPGPGLDPYRNPVQEFLNQESVFGYYLPTDRSPATNVLAPEQRLVAADELSGRMNQFSNLNWNLQTQKYDGKLYKDAGCNIAPLVAAFEKSPRGYLDYLSATFFRGAMPQSARRQVEEAIALGLPSSGSPTESALLVLGFALTLPDYGVQQ